MRAARRGRVLLAVAVLSGCSEQSAPAAPPPGEVVLRELGVAFPTPPELPDVVYVMGEGAEDKPAALLSTRSLADAGGPACAAGATGAVSPYPLGRVIVSDETPDKVERETVADPEDALGEYLAQVGDRYLYYAPAPDEPCDERPAAADLQRRQALAVKEALRRATSRP